jgi:rod shape-determining protein MreD
VTSVWQITRMLLVVALLVAAHFAIRPLLGTRVQIDFLVIALVLFSITVRPGVAALSGMVLGLLADGAQSSGFGTTMLSLAVVGYVVSWLKAAFFAENSLLNFVVIFFSAWAVALVRALLLGTGSLDTSFVITTLVWLPLSAAVTAIVGAVLLGVLRPMASDPSMARR